MKTIVTAIFLGIFNTIIFSQQIPQISKTEFSQEALQQEVIDTDNNEITIQSIIDKHRGKIMVIKFWASWCRDCLLEMSNSNELKEKNLFIIR